MTSQRMPALFIGHGSPMNALEDNQFTQAWRAIGQRFPAPKAILVISAHWMQHEVAVTAMPAPATIHDFGGFPPALFAMQYPAPGSLATAQRIQEILSPLAVKLDQEWGLDHGSWSILAKMYPDAKIPVLQLSLNMRESLSFHFELGQQLSKLRDEGVMIMGSGNVVHNLRRLNPDITSYDWADSFNQHIQAAIADGDFKSVVDYQKWGQEAQLSVPTDEHFLPLLYVLGAKRDDDQTEILCNEMVMGSISMMSVLFTA